MDHFIFCQNSTSLFSSNYLSFGSNFGLNPNYRNPKPEGYWFVEGGANVNIKKLPFILSFRHSNELLFTGRPSYFKFSLNPQQQSFNRLDLISKKLELVKSEIDALSLNLSTTKSDISYLNTLLNNQKLKNQYLSSDSLGIDYSLHAISFHVDDQLKLDSLKQLENIQLQELKLSELKYDSLQLDYQLELKKYQKPNLSFLKKFDIGLTTLPSSGISKNAIPIHGVSVGFERDKYYGSISSGFTMPNQLFSNALFDQIIYNHYNIFNQNDFFFVEKIKLVSSSIVGFGKENGSHIQVESYHAGNTFDGKLKRIENGSSLTNNVLIQKQVKAFRFVGGLGHTHYFDSVKRGPISIDRVLVYGEVEYLRKDGRMKSSMNYRKMPSDYENWVIGINTRSSEKFEIKNYYKITRRWITNLRFSMDKFQLPDSTSTQLSTRQLGFDQQLKIQRNIQLFSNYTVLNIKNSSTTRFDLSHLAKLGVAFTKNAKHSSWIVSSDLSYAKMNMRDSLSELIQISNRIQYRTGRWIFGNEVSWNRNIGIGYFSGENWTVKPYFKFEKGKFFVSGSIKRLWSEQFGNHTGGDIKLSFWFTENVGVDYVLTYYLPTEFILFYQNDMLLNSTTPFCSFLKVKIIIP